MSAFISTTRISRPTQRAVVLNRSGRKFVRTAIVLAVLSTSLFGFVGQATAGSESSQAQFTYVTVSAGETLWQLAERVAPNTDPREWIAQVVSLNGLTDNQVHPGQQIAIP
ncbi:MAG: hypothetical protein RI933_154 [Actinomycetota bacterium]|jgi:LysM repeat protein|uniref:LysM domain-containing protein n=1 Tax=Candidatus Rhodoluna planktonica TaxID=535712 RepID=A0A1D9DZK1_9MICO|nr:LysM peptidoglycan-binding domain-containing protein [Candidatus Rhodoluna planktonica]AOY56221.1 hypothetical protein A4Z71_04465 [Candidatus Rhodoluna planktonica]